MARNEDKFNTFIERLEQGKEDGKYLNGTSCFLRDKFITDADLKKMADALKYSLQNSSVDKPCDISLINLSKNQITNRGVKHLIRILEILKNREPQNTVVDYDCNEPEKEKTKEPFHLTINVSGNRIGRNGIKALKRIKEEFSYEILLSDNNNTPPQNIFDKIKKYLLGKIPGKRTRGRQIKTQNGKARVTSTSKVLLKKMMNTITATGRKATTPGKYAYTSAKNLQHMLRRTKR